MSGSANAPLIEVNDLGVQLNTSRGPAQAVRGVSFALKRGETFGLVGKSGCGKSVTALALMGLLPDSAVISGSIRLDGGELVGLSDANYCKLRGNRISMIFQEPMTALNPMHTIGRQVAEPLRRHTNCSAAEARSGGDRLARSRRPSRCGETRRCLSAPVFRRPAPAHHHCHGAGLPARRADRR